MISQGAGYCLYHSIGQYPAKAQDVSRAMAELAGVWGTPDDAQWGYLLGKRQRFIDLWRGLVNAPAGSVTTCENVTQGVHMLMTALPKSLLAGRKVLVAADCFPSNHFLLTGLAERLGFTLETVSIRQGDRWVRDEDMLARWDADVAVALVTWVSSTTSHRVDLEALIAHGRSVGSLIGVDITQGAGLLPFDMVATGADFVVSTSLKWMCGLPGAGVLMVQPELVARCQPELRGWFSQENPFSWALDRFQFAADARRFDNGTPSIISAAGSVPGLEWLAGSDRAAILAHNRRLTDELFALADDLGIEVLTPRPEPERGGSVMLRPSAAKGSPEPVDFLGALKQAGVCLDQRGDVLRFSPGVMTEAGVIEVIGDVFRRLI